MHLGFTSVLSAALILTSASLVQMVHGGGEACRAAAQAAEQERFALAAVGESRAIDLAICLDTSGSMQGLIDAARIKIWDIVNDLALAKPSPKLRVALLTFGNDGHLAENGWVNVDVGLTDDLDLISEKLFALTTNGGTELVGRVLDAASKKLEWSPSSDALKIVVVAGNESADQDTEMSFREVCKSVISGGVMINSIYCGPPSDDMAPAWKEVATLADGHFAAIDHTNGTIVISTPFDAELATLSASINTTYIPYGARGAWAASNQQEQDQNAAGVSTAVAAQRAQTKGGEMYCNISWDLVDACTRSELKLEDVKEEDLPDNMKAMTPAERKAYVDGMIAKRQEIQGKIDDLGKQRQAYVEKEMRKLAENGDKSFDAAIRNAIRAQAEARGFTFTKTAVAEEAAPAESGSSVLVQTDDDC